MIGVKWVRDGEGDLLDRCGDRFILIPVQIQTPGRLAWCSYTVAVGQDGPLFSSRWGRLGQFNPGAGTNCSMCVLFPSKGRSRTTATGRAAVGSLHVRTSSHATTGNTPATGHFSVRNVTGPSQGQTTLPST